MNKCYKLDSIRLNIKYKYIGLNEYTEYSLTSTLRLDEKQG